MGLPMVRRLVSQGRQVTVHARRSEVRAACETEGARAVDDLGTAVAEADVVVLCLYSDAQLREVLFGPGGFLDALRPGSLVISHTTGSPAVLQELADRRADRGVRVVDGPVSGSAEDIAEGRITVLLGGTEDDVERARGIVAAYGSPILHVGGLGAALAVKLINNSLMAAHLQLLADAERLAGELDVDWPKAAAAMQQSSGASTALDVVARMGSVHDVFAAAGHFLQKDVAVAQQVASELGLDLGELGRVNQSGALDLGNTPSSTVQDLVDIEAIRQLKARYFRLLDTKDWAGFAELFTDDCVHVLPTADTRPPASNADYLANIERTLADAVTVHHGVCPEITLRGPNEAEGTWAMFDDVTLPQESGGFVRLRGYGHYHETYRRCDDGRWRISSKRNVRLRVDTTSSDDA